MYEIDTEVDQVDEVINFILQDLYRYTQNCNISDALDL